MIYVFRLFHRPERDKRISTHVALVARAFGADGIFYNGIQDGHLEESVKNVVDNWGGKFTIKYVDNWKEFITNFEGVKVHLTMYGIGVDEVVDKVDTTSDLLIIVGGEKVPPDVYEITDFNIAIGNQPHSEVAALAIFLDRLFKGKELYREFPDAKIVVEPSERGKKVYRTTNHNK